jgi:quinol monooxygenase YgiN
MQIAMLLEIPGLTKEQYEQAARAINESGTTLERALIHIAGPSDGGYRVVEVWSSQAAADAFYSSELFGRLAVHMPQPTISVWPLDVLDTARIK